MSHSGVWWEDWPSKHHCLTFFTEVKKETERRLKKVKIATPTGGRVITEEWPMGPVKRVMTQAQSGCELICHLCGVPQDIPWGTGEVWGDPLQRARLLLLSHGSHSDLLLSAQVPSGPWPLWDRVRRELNSNKQISFTRMCETKTICGQQDFSVLFLPPSCMEYFHVRVPCY